MSHPLNSTVSTTGSGTINICDQKPWLAIKEWWFESSERVSLDFNLWASFGLGDKGRVFVIWGITFDAASEPLNSDMTTRGTYTKSVVLNVLACDKI